jgi:hypothetical protein
MQEIFKTKLKKGFIMDDKLKKEIDTALENQEALDNELTKEDEEIINNILLQGYFKLTRWFV